MRKLFCKPCRELVLVGGINSCAAPANFEWTEIVTRARGQTVHWNAWGGDDRINDYLAWTVNEVKREFGMERWEKGWQRRYGAGRRE